MYGFHPARFQWLVYFSSNNSRQCSSAIRETSSEKSTGAADALSRSWLMNYDQHQLELQDLRCADRLDPSS